MYLPRARDAECDAIRAGVPRRGIAYRATSAPQGDIGSLAGTHATDIRSVQRHLAIPMRPRLSTAPDYANL
ncbi:hypothetical protein GCM10027188_00500 [Lysobacter humi (ex Lee et al. 2017)]